MSLANKYIVVIAGPSASGKSHLIKHLLDSSDQLAHRTLCQKLNLSPSLNIGKLNIERLTNDQKMLKRSKKMTKEVYIVHFDLTSKHQRQRRNQLKTIASKYQNLTFVTLDLTFKTWQMRMSERIRHNFLGMPLSHAFWIYLLSLVNNRHGHNLFRSVYREWNIFLDEISVGEKICIDEEALASRSEEDQCPQGYRHNNV